MDCTYKTNKFAFPLLQVVGITPLLKSFTVCVAFMSNEKTPAYEFALETMKSSFKLNPQVIVTDHEAALANAISSVYPHSKHLLCVWHIQQNVLKKAKVVYAKSDDHKIIIDSFMVDWNKLISSNTIDEYLAAKEIIKTH